MLACEGFFACDVMERQIKSQGREGSTGSLREIMLISESGNTRPATIGRLKIETRPFLRITWQNDYQISNSIYLQQAETVRVLAGSGEAISVTKLKTGDSILCHNSNHTRHIGNKVAITSKEV